MGNGARFKPVRRTSRKLLHYPIMFVVPALLIYVVFFVYPTITGFYYSFTDWNSSTTQIRFVGLRQIQDVLSNPNFIHVLKNTIIFALLTTLGKNIFPIILAVLLTTSIKTKNILRAIYFSPAILNVVAIGLVFQGLFNPYNGFVNNALRSVGLDALALGWIGDPKLSIYMACLMEIWKAAGITMTIYIAGVQNISPDYYEAAEIDGASAWNKFKNITLPLLMPAITINVMLSLIYGFRMFEVIYFLTQGGPGNSSEVIMTMVYKYMGQGLYAYSSAMNLILVVMIIVISIPILSFMRKKEVEG